MVLYKIVSLFISLIYFLPGVLQLRWVYNRPMEKNHFPGVMREGFVRFLR